MKEDIYTKLRSIVPISDRLAAVGTGLAPVHELASACVQDHTFERK
jgi:hypothetical protein